MKLEELKDEDRTLVVVALQALFRERVSASKAVFTACSLAGMKAPEDEIYGLREVLEALQRVGAAPER
ncbi:hypothetical protein VC623_23725 [Citrobacter amalonaticus]|uniref:hypothetical protein n=1 Tax=Citrobacter amalonaticus TaxID=35703 RepID=UPI00292B917C|nr:hypothetical protein [Citrobacter amalonaticus]MDV0787609.1 hypothetical protein [Citrobacter amalonaticus]MEB0643673.1 hypothetical protein [Citrobacter amalonaticus]